MSPLRRASWIGTIVVIRAEDDTDEDYEARCRLFAAALALASKA